MSCVGCFPGCGTESNSSGEWTQAGRPIVGVCPGAQLIAVALGPMVYPEPAKEIGWFNGVRAGTQLFFPALGEDQCHEELREDFLCAGERCNPERGGYSAPAAR